MATGTRRIVPRQDLEGSLGSGEKRWEKAYIGNVGNVYDTVADMVADLELREGSTASTKGYHAVGDNGYGIYHIREKAVSDVDDGGSIIFLDNGLVAECVDIQTPRVFETVADMKTSGLFVGLTAITKCKSVPDDGFGGIYRIREKTTRDEYLSGYYLNDYINVGLDNGFVAEKIVSESIQGASNIHNTDGFMQKIVDVVDTYEKNISDIHYANGYTAWDETVQKTDNKWELDCSSFVSLVLHGVTFDNSRYNGNAENICDEDFFNRIDSMTYRYANHMAEWAFRNGYAFYPNTDFSNLEAGDILFMDYGAESESADNAFMHIGHVAIFLNKVNDDRFQIIHYGGDAPSFYASIGASELGNTVLVGRFPFSPVQNSLQNLVVHPNTEVTITNGDTQPVYKLSKPLVAGKLYTICLRANIANAKTYFLFRNKTGNLTVFSSWGNSIYGSLYDYVYQFVCPSAADGVQDIMLFLTRETGSSASLDATVKNFYFYEGFVKDFTVGSPAHDGDYPIYHDITIDDSITIETGMAAKSFCIEHETYYEVSIILPMTSALTGPQTIGAFPNSVPNHRIPAVLSIDGRTPHFGAIQIGTGTSIVTITWDGNYQYKYINAFGIVMK